MEGEVQVRLGNRDPLVVGNTVFVSSNVWDLTEKELDKARIELGETEEKKQKYLQELRSRLSKEGRYRTDDAFLLRFLRVRKFDCNRAYENIKNFYKTRNSNPECFGDPSRMRTFKTLDIVNVLPYADEEGRIVFFVNIELWDSRTMPFEEFAQPTYASSDVAISNPKMQVNGFIGIWNMKGIGLREVAELLYKNRLYSLMSLLNFTYPWRIKRIIVIHTGRVTRFLYSLVRPMLSKKLAERMILLGSDMNELHQFVNPAILPKRLGGQLDDDFCRRPEHILDNIPYLEYDRSFTGATAL